MAPNLPPLILAETMLGGQVAITYVIPEPFEQALKSIRKTLAARHIRLVGMLDITACIHKNLFISMAPCLVLFVALSPALKGPLRTDRLAAALAVFHIVVSQRGRQTEIHILAPLPNQCESLQPASIAELKDGHIQILHAIESIGMPILGV